MTLLEQFKLATFASESWRLMKVALVAKLSAFVLFFPTVLNINWHSKSTETNKKNMAEKSGTWPSSICSSGSSRPPAPRCWGSSRGGWSRSPGSRRSRPPWHRRRRLTWEPRCFSLSVSPPRSSHDPRQEVASQLSVPEFKSRSQQMEMGHIKGSSSE